MEKKNHKIGRPRAITAAVIDKLDYAFSIGASIKEAALYANISESCLYNYLKANPGYKERADMLRCNPVLKAKKCLYDDIESGDGVAARWLLERRASNEYSTRSEVAIEGGASLTIEDRQSALDGFLRQFLD